MSFGHLRKFMVTIGKGSSINAGVTSNTAFCMSHVQKMLKHLQESESIQRKTIFHDEQWIRFMSKDSRLTVVEVVTLYFGTE